MTTERKYNQAHTNPNYQTRKIAGLTISEWNSRGMELMDALAILELTDTPDLQKRKGRPDILQWPLTCEKLYDEFGTALVRGLLTDATAALRGDLSLAEWLASPKMRSTRVHSITIRLCAALRVYQVPNTHQCFSLLIKKAQLIKALRVLYTKSVDYQNSVQFPEEYKGVLEKLDWQQVAWPYMRNPAQILKDRLGIKIYNYLKEEKQVDFSPLYTAPDCCIFPLEPCAEIFNSWLASPAASNLPADVRADIANWLFHSTSTTNHPVKRAVIKLADIVAERGHDLQDCKAGLSRVAHTTIKCYYAPQAEYQLELLVDQFSTQIGR